MFDATLNSDYALTTPAQAPVVTRVPVDAGEAEQYMDALKVVLGMEAAISDYNTRLTALLATAMGAVERYTRLALQPQTIIVTYAQYDGSPLPFGPVWSTPLPEITPYNEGSSITLTDATGTGLSGGNFPYVNRLSAGTVSYTAGYSVAEGATFPIPADLRGAILEHAAASFRAGSVSGVKPNEYWKTLAAPYRRYD